MRRWSTFTRPRHAANAARWCLFLLRRSYFGKTTFHLVALGDYGKVLLEENFSQRPLITFTANLENGGKHLRQAGTPKFPITRLLRQFGVTLTKSRLHIQVEGFQ
jgi:hypothetical protein